MPGSDRRRPARFPVRRRMACTGAALAAAAVVAGCGAAIVPEPGTTSTAPLTAPSTPPAPAQVHGEEARAAGAVRTLAGALRDGDVETLCRPGAIFTTAVVASINATGPSCEATYEVLGILRNPPPLTVVRVALTPDLATAEVSANGQTIPLDLVRSGHRWLISFSDGNDPLEALNQ